MPFRPYSKLQNYCYILIIPGFGIISHVVSVFSNKPIFGQCGSLIYIYKLLNRTVGRESKIFRLILLLKEGLKSLLLNTLNYFFLFFVKILTILDNPPITKSRSCSIRLSYKLRIINFSSLSSRVGISEAIRSNNAYFYFLKMTGLVLQACGPHSKQDLISVLYNHIKTLRFLTFNWYAAAVCFVCTYSWLDCWLACVAWLQNSAAQRNATKLKIVLFFTYLIIYLLYEFQIILTECPLDAHLFAGQAGLIFYDSAVAIVATACYGRRCLSQDRDHKSSPSPYCNRQRKVTQSKAAYTTESVNLDSLTFVKQAQWPQTDLKLNNNVKDDSNFNEWLSGIIDGDGYFVMSNKGYASLEITLQLRDRKVLYLIKQKYGGSVKLKSGYNHLRYRLHHKAGLINLINGVNGLIRNPVRMLQLGKICNKYGLPLIDSKPLTYDSGWFSGFFDTDGSVYLNEKSGQIFITASQKNRFILDALVELYGGAIYPLIKKEAFKWTCFKKQEILSLVNNYFKKNPCRSEKITRLSMCKRFYELRQLGAHTALPNSDLGKVWKHFLVKWNSLLDKDIKISSLEEINNED